MANYDPLTEKDEHEQSSSTFVINDGGHLHRFTCVENETYQEILGFFLENRYWLAKIVFNSYWKASTKDIAHLKRARTSGREVLFTLSMKLTTTKEEFLSCTGKKSRSIKELTGYDGQRIFRQLTQQVMQTYLSTDRLLWLSLIWFFYAGCSRKLLGG